MFFIQNPFRTLLQNSKIGWETTHTSKSTGEPEVFVISKMQFKKNFYQEFYMKTRKDFVESEKKQGIEL